MARTSEAAGCDIFQMMPCVAASRSSGVRPSTQCCSNVATMGRGIAGARCLCSLVSQPLARSQGVVPRIALGIPQKCGIPVPRGFTCQGETRYHFSSQNLCLMTMLLVGCKSKICIELNLYHFCWPDMKSVMVVLVVSSLSKTASKSIIMGGVHIPASVSRTLHMSVYLMV